MKSFLLLLLVSNTALATLKVGVIDTGLDVTDSRFKDHVCDYKDFTDEGIEDQNGHGTHIASLIMQYAKDSNYCFYIAKAFSKNSKRVVPLENIISWLASEGVTLVNYSAGGPGFSSDEYSSLFYHPKMQFYVAAGNNSQSIDDYAYYPASYVLPNIHPVGCKHDNILCSFSNYGTRVVDWEDGVYVKGYRPGKGYAYYSGTSQSTAIRTGKEVYKQTHTPNFFKKAIKKIFTYLNN